MVVWYLGRGGEVVFEKPCGFVGWYQPTSAAVLMAIRLFDPFDGHIRNFDHVVVCARLVQSSLVYTPHKQRGITRIDFGSDLV
jgi:hypothetical protein